MQPACVLLLGAREAETQAVRGALEDLARVLDGRHADAARAFEDARPDAVLVWAPPLDGALEAVTRLAALGAHVGVVSASKDSETILRSLRAGAREYVVGTGKEELRRALRTLLGGHARGLGALVTVLPARGGAGATALATNLAGTLAARGRRVCAVDLDRYFGDVLSFLDLTPKYTLTELIANTARLDRDLLDASLARHASGLFAIAHSDKVEEAEKVRGTDVAALLAFLRRHFEYVVVDGAASFDEAALAALDASERILVVVTPDVPAVKNAQRTVELLRGIGVGEQKIRLVLNRAQRSSKIDAQVIAETTGLAIAAEVGNDFARMSSAIDRGVLLVDDAPGTRVARDLAALAQQVTGEGAAPARRPRLLGLFSRKAAADGAR